MSCQRRRVDINILTRLCRTERNGKGCTGDSGIATVPSSQRNGVRDGLQTIDMWSTDCRKSGIPFRWDNGHVAR